LSSIVSRKGDTDRSPFPETLRVNRYTSILCGAKNPEPAYSGGEIVIDLGLSSLLITSDGEKEEPGKHYRKSRSQARHTSGEAFQGEKWLPNRLKVK
jgi:transposase